MTEQHPITPPPELIRQWMQAFYGPQAMPGAAPGECLLHVATVAARWGADAELEVTNPTPLSPAAQAVLYAAYKRIDENPFNEVEATLAAALRAAADHINHDWSGFNCVDALCEIAAELEGEQ